jgi:predicted nucleotidyltransferase
VGDSVEVPRERLAEFCRRWGIAELALFGSVLRDDFGPDSDVDVLVVFTPATPRGLEAREAMEEELAALVGRRVDLVEKAALRNPFRRHEILSTHRVVYAA